MKSPEMFRYILECSRNLLSEAPVGYLTARGIGLATAMTHGLGYDPDHERLTFPYLDLYGDVVGWKGRHIGPVDPDRSVPKYYAAPGGQLGAVRPVPADDVNGPAVICEGEFDALALITRGVRAISVPGASAWGLVSPVVLDVIARSGHDEVVLAIDGDPAGDRLAAEVTGSLKDHGYAVTDMRPPAGRDVTDELTDSESTWLSGLVAHLGGSLDAPF